LEDDNKGLRVAQKRQLFTLIDIKRLNAGAKVNGLDEAINGMEAEMERGDIALVKAKVAELE